MSLCMHVYVHVCMYVCVCVCICVCHSVCNSKTVQLNDYITSQDFDIFCITETWLGNDTDATKWRRGGRDTQRQHHSTAKSTNKFHK